MDPRPIPFSSADLERRRLESTINQDLHSLSLASGSSSASDAHFPPRSQHEHADVESDTSFSSLSTIEYPRAAQVAYPSHPDLSFHQSAYPKLVGPHGTPRAASGDRKVSQMSERSFLDASPVSTAGHHVSAVTLAEGVFKRTMGVGKGIHGDDSGSEWDPDRSLGRLVGELGKAMKNISPRPSSPFSPPRSPRSPSPYTTFNPTLSFTLNVNDPLPSPPVSRHGSGSGSSAGSKSRMNSVAPAQSQTQTKTRRPLGDTTVHNITQSQARPQHVAASKPKPKIVQDTPMRPASAPTRLRPHDSADVTGMTGLLETPAKGLVHGSIGKNGDVGDDAAAGIPGSLATLHARLRALETENSVSRRRVRELEVELERAKDEVELARTGGQGKLQEVVGEKTALEDLVKSLRTQLSRLTIELEHHKTLVTELRESRAQPPNNVSNHGSTEVTRELVALRQEVERLGTEVHRLGGIVEQGLETRKKARGEETIRMEENQPDLISLTDEDVERAQKDVENRAKQPSKLRQALHRAGSPDPQVAEATFVAGPPAPTRPVAAVSKRANAPPPAQARPVTPPAEHRSPQSDTSSKANRTKTHRPTEGPASPFPSIREEDEVEFFEVSKRIPTLKEGTKARTSSARRKSSPLVQEGQDVPAQTVLTRVIGELEADFKHYKSIYCELADQYKVLDAASAIAKRHVLAEHLKEVIDTLEQKADQISSLYDLLTFKDKPDTRQGRAGVMKSVPDILRMVKESLGEEGLRRLQEDGGIRR